MWLAGGAHPDFDTINRFRNRIKAELNDLFTQLVLYLSEQGFITLDVVYVDGTKIESKSNRYRFVWKKAVKTKRTKLLEQIKIILNQIDEEILQDQNAKPQEIDLSPEKLEEFANSFQTQLEEKRTNASGEKDPSSLEKGTALLEKLTGQIKKLETLDNQLATLGDRNSYSTTDKDASFMNLKEDADDPGRTKPAYNLQVGMNHQFITHFDFYQSPTDTQTLPDFQDGYKERYGRYPKTQISDSGYGSEENYKTMKDRGIEAYVKYIGFHSEQADKFKNDLFRKENLTYNPEGDYYVCPVGQKLLKKGFRHRKSRNGFVSEVTQYEAGNCSYCILKSLCTRAKGNRIIEVNYTLEDYKKEARERLNSKQGRYYRSQRSIECEAVFGQIKQDGMYRRFRHFGMEQVKMDFTLLVMAFNIKKLFNKIKKHPKQGDAMLLAFQKVSFYLILWLIASDSKPFLPQQDRKSFQPHFNSFQKPLKQKSVLKQPHLGNRIGRI